jgi:predicted nucleotidyltransferase
MKNLTPIVLIAVSIGVFFLVIDPAYKKVQENNETITENAEMIDLANQLRRERENLNARFNAISADDKEKLEKVLPDAVDNVRLIRDIQDIAATFGITISNIGVTGNTDSGNESNQTASDRERNLIANSGGASF